MDPRFVVAVFLALSATLSTAAAFTSDRSGGFPTTMAEDCSYSMSLEASRTPSDASSVSSTAAPTVILGFDVPTVSSLMGAYVCHAVMLNAAFTMLALLSQRLQQLLGIDTGALLMGRLSGLLTVTLGGYTAYKLSEQLLEWLIARLTRNGTIRRGEQLLNILRNRCKRSVAAPLCAMAAVGSAAPSCRAIQGVAKAIAFCMPSISPVAQAKNQVIGTNGDATATVSVPLTSPGPRTQEAAVIAFYCLSTFFLLGGRLHSFTPSDITHPGAFAVPNASLLADGYNYAGWEQKRAIQRLGRAYGCHTCGRTAPKYFADHQPPSGVVKRKLRRSLTRFLLAHRLVPLSLVRPRQYFYPQCPECSAEQAAAVRTNRKKVVTHYGVLRPYHLCASGYLVGRALLDTRWRRAVTRCVKRR